MSPRQRIGRVAAYAAMILVAGALFGRDSVYVDQGLFFSGAAVITFGGAYAVLAYVAQQAVEVYGWLAPGEMVHGLALAETTPGPLVMVTQWVGGVAAYRDQVSVVGVGFDIACGNAAIRTDIELANLGRTPEEVHKTLTQLADGIAASVSFGVGRRNRADDAPVDHPLFDDASWDAVPDKYRKGLKVKARQQLGTVGSGNHYVDVFADETGTLWVGVHFGSRGFGHTVASGFLALGQGKAWGS